MTALGDSVFWGYLLGVDWSVGIIESPDHIMSKPGARHDGTQPWEGRQSTTEINRPISTSSKPRESRHAFIPFIGTRRLAIDSSTISF